MSDLVAYVADASRAHASRKRIPFDLDVPDSLTVGTDAMQLQPALMNVSLHAVEACTVRWQRPDPMGNHGARIHIDVENAGSPIGRAGSEPTVRTILHHPAARDRVRARDGAQHFPGAGRRSCTCRQ